MSEQSDQNNMATSCRKRPRRSAPAITIEESRAIFRAISVHGRNWVSVAADVKLNTGSFTDAVQSYYASADIMQLKRRAQDHASPILNNRKRSDDKEITELVAAINSATTRSVVDLIPQCMN